MGILFLSDMICMCFFALHSIEKTHCFPFVRQKHLSRNILLPGSWILSLWIVLKLWQNWGLYSYVFYSVRSHKSFLVSSGTGKIYSSRTDRSYHWSPWAPAVRVFLIHFVYFLHCAWVHSEDSVLWRKQKAYLERNSPFIRTLLPNMNAAVTAALILLFYKHDPCSHKTFIE